MYLIFFRFRENLARPKLYNVSSSYSVVASSIGSWQSYSKYNSGAVAAAAAASVVAAALSSRFVRFMLMKFPSSSLPF